MRLKYKHKISHETIYRIIFYLKKLRRLGSEFYQFLKIKNKLGDKRGFARGLTESDKLGIAKRNELFDIQHEAFHFLIDVMEGKKGEKEPVLLVLREARSSYLFAHKIWDKKAETIRKIIIEVLRGFERVSSLTFDNGSENALYKEIEKELNTRAFFCRPGCPWEKGEVENGIRDLRQFFPKGKSLKHITQEEIDRALLLINSRPMQKLVGFSAANVFAGARYLHVPASYNFSLVF